LIVRLLVVVGPVRLLLSTVLAEMVKVPGWAGTV